MPNVRQPRSGSLQYWPRKRAKRAYARIRSHSPGKLSGFAGYKVGMTHVMAIEANKYSHLKGETVRIPVTMVECPPIQIGAVRFYKKKGHLMQPATEAWVVGKADHLYKKVHVPKKAASLDKIKPEEYDMVRIIVFTQPHLAGFGKKRPDVFELEMDGSIEEIIKFAKENTGKDIPVTDILKEGSQVDVKSITTGKGFQGPVKRFGIAVRSHKSEKTKRGPGSLGPWVAQQHIMWKVPKAGKMGYHQRTELNKLILKVAEPKELEFDGGIMHYGNVKNPVLLLKGSLPGPRKRLIMMQHAQRPTKVTLPTIQSISTTSKQGK